MNQNKLSLSVIILTFNEEANLSDALESVVGWADQVFVVDSFSTDKTLEIAKRYGCEICQNQWTNWADQRNWALDNLPLKNDWTFFLDADERISNELKEEIMQLFEKGIIEYDGFYINRHFIFMNRRLKHGGYNSIWVLRLVNRRKTRVIKNGIREYFVVDGKVGKLRHHMVHNSNKDISFWIDKHNRFATLEARELLKSEKNKVLAKDTSIKNKEVEGKARIWVREKIWSHLPVLIRPFIAFVYRYFFRLGFLDGKEGFVYFFLHEFWYPFLVDVKYLELKRKVKGFGKL